MLRKDPFVTGEYYHLYNRGIDKRVIFKTKRDYERFMMLLYLANGKESFHLDELINREHKIFNEVLFLEKGEPLVSIGAWCLMTNHFHLLVKQGVEGGITKFMRKLGVGYSMFFNIKYQRTGSLFGVNNSAAGVGTMQLYSNNSPLVFGTSDAYALTLGTNSTGVITILPGGNVGFGTTGPDAKLDALATTEQLRLTYADGTNYSSFTQDVNGWLTIAQANNSSEIFLKTKNSSGTVKTFEFNSDGIFIAPLSFRAYLAGSDSVASGPNIYLANADNTRAWVVSQLTASNHLDMWYYNGTSWTQMHRFENDGDVLLGVAGSRTTITDVLNLAGRTSDPTASDGDIWYRSDTDEFRVRANGVTYKLLVEIP